VAFFVFGSGALAAYSGTKALWRSYLEQRFTIRRDVLLTRQPVKADSFVMFHKGLALVLVLSWIILSGTVVTEPFHVSEYQFHTSTYSATWIAKPEAVLADDPTESSDNPPLGLWEPLETATAGLPTCALRILPRCSKLHKLHHVFLI
jgi:hypothetical protein